MIQSYLKDSGSFNKKWTHQVHNLPTANYYTEIKFYVRNASEMGFDSIPILLVVCDKY
jgi:hypothetical protein